MSQQQQRTKLGASAAKPSSAATAPAEPASPTSARAGAAATAHSDDDAEEESQDDDLLPTKLLIANFDDALSLSPHARVPPPPPLPSLAPSDASGPGPAAKSASSRRMGRRRHSAVLAQAQEALFRRLPSMFMHRRSPSTGSGADSADAAGNASAASVVSARETARLRRGVSAQSMQSAQSLVSLPSAASLVASDGGWSVERSWHPRGSVGGRSGGGGSVWSLESADAGAPLDALFTRAPAASTSSSYADVSDAGAAAEAEAPATTAAAPAPATTAAAVSAPATTTDTVAEEADESAEDLRSTGSRRSEACAGGASQPGARRRTRKDGRRLRSAGSSFLSSMLRASDAAEQPVAPAHDAGSAAPATALAVTAPADLVRELHALGVDRLLFMFQWHPQYVRAAIAAPALSKLRKPLCALATERLWPAPDDPASQWHRWALSATLWQTLRGAASAYAAARLPLQLLLRDDSAATSLLSGIARQPRCAQALKAALGPVLESIPAAMQQDLQEQEQHRLHELGSPQHLVRAHSDEPHTAHVQLARAFADTAALATSAGASTESAATEAGAAPATTYARLAHSQLLVGERGTERERARLDAEKRVSLRVAAALLDAVAAAALPRSLVDACRQLGLLVRDLESRVVVVGSSFICLRVLAPLVRGFSRDPAVERVLRRAAQLLQTAFNVASQAPHLPLEAPDPDADAGAGDGDGDGDGTDSSTGTGTHAGAGTAEAGGASAALRQLASTAEQRQLSDLTSEHSSEPHSEQSSGHKSAPRRAASSSACRGTPVSRAELAFQEASAPKIHDLVRRLCALPAADERAYASLEGMDAAMHRYDVLLDIERCVRFQHFAAPAPQQPPQWQQHSHQEQQRQQLQQQQEQEQEQQQHGSANQRQDAEADAPRTVNRASSAFASLAGPGAGDAPLTLSHEQLRALVAAARALSADPPEPADPSRAAQTLLPRPTDKRALDAFMRGRDGALARLEEQLAAHVQMQRQQQQQLYLQQMQQQMQQQHQQHQQHAPAGAAGTAAGTGSETGTGAAAAGADGVRLAPRWMHAPPLVLPPGRSQTVPQLLPAAAAAQRAARTGDGDARELQQLASRLRAARDAMLT